MKPFDLEKALAGHPVCTRDGRPVTQLHRFTGLKFPVAGIIDGTIYLWRESGEYCNQNTADFDLMLASTKVKRWVVTYRPYEKQSIRWVCGGLFTCKEEAELETKHAGHDFQIHEIEVEL